MCYLHVLRVSQAKYLRQGKQGQRLPGWEQYNIQALADEIGANAHHVRSVLTRRSNTTFQFLELLATALGMSVPDLTGAMIRAAEKDKGRKPNSLKGKLQNWRVRRQQEDKTKGKVR